MGDIKMRVYLSTCSPMTPCYHVQAVIILEQEGFELCQLKSPIHPSVLIDWVQFNHLSLSSELLRLLSSEG